MESKPKTQQLTNASAQSEGRDARLVGGIGVLGLALLLCAMVAGCSDTGPESPVLAKVGDREITVADFENELIRRSEIGRPLENKDEILEEMIEHVALVQEAERSALSDDPSVQREIEKLLIGKLRTKALDPKLEALSIEEDELRAEYERRIGEFTTPAKERLAIIYMEFRDNMSETKQAEVRARMESAREKAVENPPEGGRGAAAQGFGPIAIEFSEDQVSRYRGGDIGWLEPGRFESRLPRIVLKTGFALQMNEISSIVRADDGLYLIKKFDARPETVRSFRSVRVSLRQSALLRGREDLKREFLSDVKSSVGVKVFKSELEQLTIPENSVDVIVSPPSLPQVDEAPLNN